jgi:hypothetical protein
VPDFPGVSGVPGEPVGSAGVRAPRHPARRPAWVPPAVSVVAYLALAALAFWPVEPFSRSHLLGCACSDPVQETWFIAWPAYAITHGRNPFFTGLLEYPHGVNLALNTSMPLLGVLVSPITWIRGPVAAFNALMRLSFAASATSMLFVVRRFTTWWPAAFLAGLLYGFSPYMVGQGFGHLFLTFAPLPPLIALCLYELGRSSRGPFVWRAVLLGALCVAQLLISIEVLVTTVVCCAVAVLVVVARHPVAALERASRLGAALGVALSVFVPLVAYPMWFFLRGPQHVIGPPHAVSNIAPIRADLLGPIVPTLNERLGPAHLLAIGTSFAAGDRPENGVYLGIPLIILLLLLLVRCRRDAAMCLGAVICLTGLVLSFGTPLTIDNHATGIPMPFSVLTHLPLVQGVVAIRFSLYEQLGAALMLGIGLDTVRRGGWWPRHDGERTSGGGSLWPRTVIVALIGIVALIPLIPRYPYPSPPVALPAYFTSGAVGAVPAGSVVLTYPYDIDPDNEAMLWQAETGMGFAIPGGQASTPGAGGRATSAVAQLSPPQLQQLFRAAMFGNVPPNGAVAPPFDAATIAAIREFCVRYDIGTVLLQPIGVRPLTVVAYLTAALGRPPVESGGIDVWYRADAAAKGLLRAK